MRHKPVLLEEVIENLNLKAGMMVVDCTIGDGGHAEAILERLGKSGKLLGIDADPESMLRAKQFLYKYENKTIFVRDNFVNLEKILQENKFFPVDGVLIDLGWSSPQFEERGRGFSFQKDEPLDMRYFTNGSELDAPTAHEILNNESEEDIEEILRVYGEEKFSLDIAQEVIKKRKDSKIEKTGDLVDIILSVYRKKLKTNKDIPWLGDIHPATKTFQALRIAVNDELGVLERVLPQAVEALVPGGRLVVISFHSLEDRIVKHYFKSQKNKSLKIINKKPITASNEEIKNNPRSRSAKLRVIEKFIANSS